ncbi:16S rRNA (guanine(527)-N(7))-methyltransferase RsmG [Candidatus Chlorohelix sp.]|uniref:16S rRNA (guanine(527)-N(7))-methyltransferase RsmG n=1 Tax=Candidatus Chlorohelix sp. TaxID=3139201 RepID=UPI00301EE1F5
MTLDLLVSGARSLLNIELTEEQLARFQLYYETLVDWNERINLTAIIAYEEVQLKHFLDSLTLASPRLRGDPPGFTLDLNNAALVDIGAGAGFPGLPLKILYPGLKLTLSDSVGKKTAFLTHLVGKLQLREVQIINGRAEELGQNSAHRQRYQIATGRAVAALNVLSEYCLPLCKVGGLFIAPKKGNLFEELKAGAPVVPKLGGRLRQTPIFDLPGEDNSGRRLIVAQKIAPTPAIYPRGVGVPAKTPLG